MTLPWDTPGLPTRLPEERCRWHEHCAYRDDDPNRCTLCHATIALGQCTCEHGPLTLAATDTIRGQFMAGASVREIMEDYGMGRDQARRILMGLLSRANPDEMDGTVL